MPITVVNNNSLVSALQQTNPITINLPSAVDMSSVALQAAASAEESASRVDLGALDNAVALSTQNAVDATSSKNLAEAARDAAIAAGAWDYTPADNTALAAITGMTAGQTALVVSTMHLWAYDGSDWQDQGASPLDVKANVADGFKVGDFPLPPIADANGVEILGFDSDGKAILRVAAWGQPLAALGVIIGDAEFPSLCDIDGVELLGFEDGKARFAVSADVARQVFALYGSQFDPLAAGLFPSADIAIWGTSLSARVGSAAHGYTATSVAAALAIELGRPVFNGAVGGTNSYAISIRQGGRPFPCTLDGGQIPATTTAVAITDWGGHDAYNNQTAQTRSGTLAGVAGTLTRLSDPGDATITTGWTFTRSEAGDAVAVPDGSPFIFDDAIAYKNRVHIIEAMRNDPYDTRAEIVAQRDNILLMTQFSGESGGAVDPRFVVVGPWPANPETTGSSYAAKAKNRLTENKLTFGPAFVDLWDYMVNWLIYDLGITPTADDLIDIGNGIIPRSLMDDSTHLNGAGCWGIAKFYARLIRARGWMQP